MDEIIQNLKKQLNLNEKNIFEITFYNKKWDHDFLETKKKYFSKLKKQKGFLTNKEIKKNIFINIWNSIEDYEKSFENSELLQKLSDFTDTFETINYEIIKR